MHPLVRDVLGHRYLYYVLTTPVISDETYDELESCARRTVPRDDPHAQLLFTVGSSLPEDYPEEALNRANELLEAYSL